MVKNETSFHGSSPKLAEPAIKPFLQLLAIGIVGKYLGRMFIETKQHPIYLPIGLWILWQRQWAVVWQRLPWVGGIFLTAVLCVPWYWLAELKISGLLPGRGTLETLE